MNQNENKKSSKRKTLLTNTFVLGIGVFASKFLVFLMMPFYTGILTPGEYGVADLISQTANLLMPLACVGISDGIFRFAMDREEDKRKVISSGLLVLAVSSIIFLALSPLIGITGYFKNYIILIAAYVISANLHSVCAQYLRACGKTGLFALQGIINTVLVILLNVLFLLVFDMRVEGYVLSVVISDALVSLVLLFPCKVYKQIRARFVDRSLIKKILKYSIPMIPATIFWWVTSVSDRYMVTYFSGETVNGLYTAAYKIPTLLALLSTVFMEAWQYSAVTAEDEGNVHEKSAFFSEIFKKYQALMFTACSFIVAFSQLLISLLCAENYFEAWRFVPILTVSSLFSGMTAFLGSVYLLKKKSVMTLITSMTGAVVNIILNLALIPIIGAQGAAVATLASYVTVFIIRAVNTRKYLKFSYSISHMAVNLIIISVQTALLLIIPEYVWITQSISLAAIVAINIVPILSEISKIVRAFLKKVKKV